MSVFLSVPLSLCRLRSLSSRRAANRSAALCCDEPPEPGREVRQEHTMTHSVKQERGEQGHNDSVNKSVVGNKGAKTVVLRKCERGKEKEKKKKKNTRDEGRLDERERERLERWR